jgi:hypothetical protein
MPLRDFDKLILHQATVHALDDEGRIADAIGFAAGRVTAVGSLGEVRKATPGAEERALHGASVYPGFIDAHHHLCFAATYANHPEVRCPPHRTIPSILNLVAECAERTPPGEWIVIVGFDENGLDERRKPTRFEIDRVASEHPVLLIHFSYHEGVLNTLGLRRSGLAGQRHDPPGGSMGRSARGEPDGTVFERCFGHAESVARAALARNRDAWFAQANAYQERLLAAGITHVCDAAVPPSMEELYRLWQARGELIVGVTMMPLVENMFDTPLPRLDGTATGWRDGRLRIGPLKLFADGGIRCAMCLHLREAILQLGVMFGNMLRHRSLAAWRLATQQRGRLGRGGTLHTGLSYYDAGGLQSAVRKACDAGFSVGIHAAGNEAIELAIAALAQRHHGALPPRIDHFFFVDQGPLRRAVSEGIHVVVQPIQLHDTGDLLRQTGLPPRLRFQAFGEMLSEGALLAGSSDAPVSTFNVLAGIETAVRRRAASGATMSADQAIGIGQALRMYTRGAAAVLGMEGEIGQLRSAARADAVVLSEDLEKVPAERIGEVGVVATFAGRWEWAPLGR